jgi:hypothetical protein
MRKIFKTSVLTACVLAASIVHAQAVGRIERAQGEARVTGNLGERSAKNQLLIEEGDRIYTEKNSEVVLRMSDGAVIAIRPSSSVEIQTYQYNPNSGGNSVIGLLRGGLRKVTGLIAKMNKENVTVRTATATIGVRGTDFEALFVDEESINDKLVDAKTEPGTYNKVFAGGTTLEQDGKQIEVGVNQSAFAPLDPLAVALKLGLIKAIPQTPGYRGGRFDNSIQNIQNEALRNLPLTPAGRATQGLLNSVPKAPDGNNNAPDLGDMLRRRP